MALASLIGICSHIPSAAAQTAQDAEATVLQEVTVTATRREERQQDVPISLSAFTQATLDTLSVTSVDDLTRITPGVTFVRNGVSGTSAYNDEGSDINIRGVESTAGASTTGIYIDDTPIQSRKIGFGTQNAYPAIFDLDRVEVLRGPQGTLFGASSEGGTIRFIQPTPSLTTDSTFAKTEIGYTQNGAPSYEIGAANGGPLIDNVLGYRVSVSYRRDGGWIDRVNNNTGQVEDPNANWHETVTARLALTWKPMDNLTITPSLYYQRFRINDTSTFWPALSDPEDERFVNGNAGPTNSTDPFYIVATRLEWNWDSAQLISNTSFYSRNQYGYSDFTEYLNELYFGSSYPTYDRHGSGYLTDSQNNFYQEVRLASVDSTARVTWTAGLFYTHSNENSIENIVDPTLNGQTGGAVCAQFPCPGGQIYSEPYNRVIDKQLAGFGEAVLRVTDTLKVTGGVRVSHDIIEGSSLAGGPFFGQAAITSSASSSETPVTPKAVVAWQPDADNLFYASASKGFRPGGVNAGVGTLCESNLAVLGFPIGPDGHRDAPSSFHSDSLWSYEIGGKNTLLERRLQINSSLFYIDWRDVQENVILGECGLEYTGNLGRVRSVGGDLQVLAKPADPLTLGFSAAYVDAKYTETSCATSEIVCTGPDAAASPVVSAGDRLVGAPWSFTATGDYEFQSVSDMKPYLHVDYTYTTKQTALLPIQDSRNGVNDPTLTGLPETRDFSFRGGMRWGGLDVSLFAKNLFDEHPILFENRDFAASYVTLYWQRSVAPRTVGLTATYRY